MVEFQSGEKGSLRFYYIPRAGRRIAYNLTFAKKKKQKDSVGKSHNNANKQHEGCL